jgi:hypothetical protein
MLILIASGLVNTPLDGANDSPLGANHIQGYGTYSRSQTKLHITRTDSSPLQSAYITHHSWLTATGKNLHYD